MQLDVPSASGPDGANGLPAVQPPSGKFIAQLFLVPFIIVSVVVGFLLLVNWLVGNARSPDDFLSKLDNSNVDVRWRGAQDLAQVLLRDEHLASDPKFALDLVDRLRQASQIRAADAKSAQEQAQLQMYLCACLGNVMLPVGAPMLDELAVRTDGGDAAVVARRRWRAVWALANLGENLKRFDHLLPGRRQAVLAELEQEAASSSPPRAEYAAKSLTYLTGPRAGSLATLGVDRTLLQCAEEPDPFLREITAFALNFWQGSAEENARVENALAKLTRDNGRGEELLVRYRDDPDKPDNTAEDVVRVPGLKIRYNATVALARRGSEKVRLGVLREMLDESQQQKNFILKQKGGDETPDQATATLTVTSALQAVAELHRQAPKRDLSELYPAIDELAHHADLTVRKEAERTLQILGRL
jgi:hypothetical protein